MTSIEAPSIVIGNSYTTGVRRSHQLVVNSLIDLGGGFGTYWMKLCGWAKEKKTEVQGQGGKALNK